MRHILPTTLTACLLVACATGGGVSPDTVAAGIARSAPPGSKILIADVPASADFLANSMIVAAQSSGMTASGSVHNILQALAADNAHIGISGRSGSVNLATLKRALNDYNGHSNAHVYIHAAPADIAALQQLAAPKGITIHAL